MNIFDFDSAECNEYTESLYYKQTHISYPNLAKYKGRLWEYKVFKLLNKFEKNGAMFLFSLLMPIGGGATEVDIIMITKRAVYVIEAKKIGGKIWGNVGQYYWNQTYFDGKMRYHNSIINPIAQNRTHARAVVEALQRAGVTDFTHVPIFPISVFDDRCVCDVSGDIGCEFAYASKLVTLINKCEKSVKTTFTKEQRDYLWNILSPYIEHSPELVELHLQRLSYKHSHCPKCGSLLQEVKLTKGVFKGNTELACTNTECNFHAPMVKLLPTQMDL